MKNKEILKKIAYLLLIVATLLGYLYLTDLAYYGIYKILLDYLNISQNYLMSNFYMIEISVYLIMFIPLLLIYISLFPTKGLKKTKYSNKILLISVASGLGVSGLSCLWMFFLDKLGDTVPILSKSLKAMEESNSSLASTGKIGVVLIALICAPIIEEIIFRGIVFNSLDKIKTGYMPIIVSAILFGVYHMNIVQAVYCIFMGIVAALIYKKTNNLIYPIIAHMSNNLIGVLQTISGSDSIGRYLDFFTVAMIAFMILGLINLYKNDKVS